MLVALVAIVVLALSIAYGVDRYQMAQRYEKAEALLANGAFDDAIYNFEYLAHSDLRQRLRIRQLRI